MRLKFKLIFIFLVLFPSVLGVYGDGDSPETDAGNTFSNPLPIKQMFTNDRFDRMGSLNSVTDRYDYYSLDMDIEISSISIWMYPDGDFDLKLLNTDNITMLESVSREDGGVEYLGYSVDGSLLDLFNYRILVFVPESLSYSGNYDLSIEISTHSVDQTTTASESSETSFAVGINDDSFILQIIFIMSVLIISTITTVYLRKRKADNKFGTINPIKNVDNLYDNSIIISENEIWIKFKEHYSNLSFEFQIILFLFIPIYYLKFRMDFNKKSGLFNNLFIFAISIIIDLILIGVVIFSIYVVIFSIYVVIFSILS